MVNKVVNERRVKRIDSRPLEIEEFIPYLAKTEPLYKKNDTKFRDFQAALPLKFRKRTSADDQAEKAAQEAQQDQEKDKKKKEKKK